MIPKFRAWDNGVTDRETSKMFNVVAINFELGRVYSSWDDESGKNLYAPIKDVILMQYTGLKDNNGAEIYEGDIVKHTDKVAGIVTINQVYYRKGSLVFDVKIDDLVYDVPLYRIHPDNSEEYEDELEVLGNIYEHPELLKEQNK